MTQCLKLRAYFERYKHDLQTIIRDIKISFISIILRHLMETKKNVR